MAMLGKLAAETRAAIGRELRLMYKEIIAEGVRRPPRRRRKERTRSLPSRPPGTTAGRCA
jgi:hypothetical protein